ncbi:Plant-drug/metabolite exporter [Trema orientale]|uniref:WAT1-related protein n=1 Tax=Trema orientale TaxID=63057 RepID=A0A2P5DRQ2_TREOI|nr:Plant-drug/metabolite exporter [Trema orientale]
MASWDCKRDVVPFIAMAIAECCTVSLHTLYKAANSNGLHYFVFMTYSYGFGTLLLFPISTVFSRRGLTSFNFKLPLLCRFVLLWIMGFLARVFGYKGLEYSSPALSSAISTLAPAFTFILAIIFRMEDVDLKRSSTRAKIIGTIVSVSGALLAVLYEGPTLLSSQSGSIITQSPLTTQTNWVIAGLLLVTEQLLNSGTYILLIQILRIYPAELIVSFVYCLGVTIITIPVSLVAESDLSAWILRPGITLAVIVYSAFFGQVFILTIRICCLPSKGPLYISIFKPISIIVAAAASVIFLGDALHIGSVVGAIILLLGFYAVLWAKAKEQRSTENLRASVDEETPLLQGSREVKYLE